MKKLKLLFFAIAISHLFISSLCAQKEYRVLYFVVGSGTSILGTGDIFTFNFQNELDLYLNKYFSTSVSFVIGQGLNSFYTPSSNLRQGNLNVLLSPLGNHRKFNFRIGTGLAYYRSSATRLSLVAYENNQIIETRYVNTRGSAAGFSIVIDCTLKLNDKYNAGMRLFTRPYADYEINTGILLRVGMKL